MTKRKRKSGTQADAELTSSGQKKRARQSADYSRQGSFLTSQSVSYGRVDPTYGQRSAIPGLDDDDDGGGDDEYEDGECGEDGDDDGGTGEAGESDAEYGVVDAEALKYLRSVREEASGIPSLLVAPRSTMAHSGGGDYADGDVDGEGVDRGIYEDGVGDSRGWYEDGAYTAAPSSPPSSLSGASRDGGGTERDAQDVYYESLLAKFETLRQRLAQVPPRHAVERLDLDHGCYMSSSVKDYKTWRWRLANTEPKPAQLAGMDKGTVLRLLRMAGNKKGAFLDVKSLVGKEGVETRRRVSAWIWGLLARLPGRGELVSEEIGVVRELGKRAVWVAVEMKGIDMGRLEEHMGDGGGDDEEDDEFLDLDVDGEDEELDPEVDVVEFTNGRKTPSGNQRHDVSYQETQSSSSLLDPPIIGPASLESLQGQLSPNFNTIYNDSLSAKSAAATPANEDEALATARARLLARLGTPPDQEQAPVLTDDISPLLEESDRAMSLPHSNPHETLKYTTALQEQLGRLISAMERQTDLALQQRLEVRIEAMLHLLEARKPSVEHVEASGPVTGGGRAAADDVGEDGECVDSQNGGRAEKGVGWDRGANRHAEGGSGGGGGGAVDYGQDGAEAHKGNKHGAVQAAKVLLDVVITIAGEVYGQRDLLEFREVW